MSDAATALRQTELFNDIPEDLLVGVGRLMTPLEFDAGEALFSQGDPGHSLLVVESGSLESFMAAPGGRTIKLFDLGPGEVLGELALLGEGGRTATVVATEPTVCWELERSAFEVLRNDGRGATTELVRRIGMQAVERLRSLYSRVAPMIDDEPPQSESAPMTEHLERESVDYLASLLFFEHFSKAEIAESTAPLRCFYARRDTVVVRAGESPDALYLVLRGAVETSLRGAKSSRRIRLAGPGRVVGHRRVIADSPYAAFVESRARENSILMEIPLERFDAMMVGNSRLDQRFSDAIWTDAVRAVQYGEHQIPSASS